MHKMTLVCSVHNAIGTCNVEQLVKILREIEPEVVFQEVRSSQEKSLEALAVAEYCKFKLCNQVHVDDLNLPSDAFETKHHLDSGFDYVAECSEEYQLLKYENITRTSQYGFSYLNSVDSVQAIARMEEVEDEIMGGKAADALRWWRQFMYDREVEMMRTIYSHCRKHAFDTGVFLVGAGHRTGIAKQIDSFSEREPDLIAWNFYEGRFS